MSGLLGMAPILLAPSMAAAIFPPIYHDPVVTVAPTVVVAPTVPTTPITPTVPSKPTVTTTTTTTTTTTPVASTPEPASIVTGITGLLLACVYIRRRNGRSAAAPNSI